MPRFQQQQSRQQSNINEKRERHTSNDNLIANNLRSIHCLQNVNTKEPKNSRR